MNLYLIVAAVAYLLGSIPFGFILVKIFRGEDIRLSGSGNIGATNVVRSGAKGLGAATLVLDAVKGALAVAFAWWIGQTSLNQSTIVSYYGSGYRIPILRLMALAALFAVLGHILPLWLKFKGGKGVATALGVFVLLFPKAVLISLVVFIVLLAVFRYVSLGSILAALAFAVSAYLLYRPEWPTLVLTSAVSLIVVVKHHQNIRRLLAGSENRLGASKAQPQAKEKQA